MNDIKMHIFLSKAAAAELHFLSPHYLKNDCLECLRVETQAPYLIAHLPPVPGFCADPLTIHIPHSFVVMLAEDSPAMRMGFVHE